MSLTVGLTVDWPDEFVVPSFPVPPKFRRLENAGGLGERGGFLVQRGKVWQRVGSSKLEKYKT